LIRSIIVRAQRAYKSGIYKKIYDLIIALILARYIGR
jgi:hypothetical protein